VILVDTSVWIEHLRRGRADLSSRLLEGEVATHPFVIGELALGGLRRRGEILGMLRELPGAPIADHEEVLELIENRALDGRGIGWVDAHLLASALLGRLRLWTLDRRLALVATRLGIASGD
jgi:hypothetical protein